MKQFAALYAELDALTATNARLAALIAYFQAAPAADAAWAVYFLAGGKPRQIVPVKVLRLAAREAAALPEWLFDECYDAVGDLAETISLVLPEPQADTDTHLADWVAGALLPLRGEPPEVQIAALQRMWRSQSRWERFVGIKLITGSLRIGVSRLAVTRALAAVSGVDAKLVAQRLVGYTAQAAMNGRALPDADAYLALIAPGELAADGTAQRGGQPYPFFLAHPWQQPVEAMAPALGDPADWLVEWKWDGIRAQLVKRDGNVWVWSRGEDLVTERFPELQAAGMTLPDGTVLDGEILVWQHGRVAPFALLQQRIGRKHLSGKLLAEAPVILLAYDLLEWQGRDLRAEPQSTRRALLEQVVAEHRPPGVQVSPVIDAADWAELATIRASSRERGVEGMMLKARGAQYGVGRTKDVGTWWKWKIDPYSVDAVLIYAQAGHGRRASLYTDYTFAVWDQPTDQPNRVLVPFAKAYSGLTDDEIRQVDAIVRRTTVEKFGPVRSVTPTLVFELGFEGIAASGRHKSGIAVRFPRILRWRHDKPVAEADTLESLRVLLASGSAA